MKLEDLEVSEVDSFIDDLSNKNPFTKRRFYYMAYRESERLQKEQEIRDKINDRNVSNITIVSDDISIVKFGYEPNDDIYYMAFVDGNLVRTTSTYTFDEALLLGLMKKYNNVNGFSFVAKALGMKIGEKL